MTATLGSGRPRAAPLLPTVLGACLLVAGCGGSPTASVRGTATLDGRPLAAGRVVFAAEGRSYMGLIGADGRYELRGAVPAGIVPGTYGVAVLPPEPELVTDPKTTQLRQVNTVDPKQYPERFRSSATSGITHAVTAGDNTIDVALSSK